MTPTTRWSAGELIPLADRMRYMLLVRTVLIASVGLAATAAPGLVGTLPPRSGWVLAAWGASSLAAEGLRRAQRGRGLPVFGATLILDGVVLSWLTQAGIASNVRYLIFLHMVAVVLLASYRTGLKMAMWYSLLLFTLLFARQDGVFRLGSGIGGWDRGQLGVFVGALWGLALATAVFSSVNERELRRRRFDLEALAGLASALEGKADPETVGATLLDGLAGAFPVGRLVLIGSGPRPSLLGLKDVSAADASAPELGPSSALLWAQTHRETLLVSGFDPEADPWLTGVLGEGGRFMVVPMYAEGGCVGVLVAEHAARGGSRVERRLVSIIERFASHAALAVRNASLIEQMEHMASTDGLTQLANHRTFYSVLEKEMARSVRSGEPLGLVMLDIDNFKALNDAHGHTVGDEVLRQVAATLKATSRGFDTIARYGGEEFAVILPGCGLDEAEAGAERLRNAVAEGPTDLPVTVSVGVASYPAHSETPRGLVKLADEALYQAKRSGKNRVCTADVQDDGLAASSGEQAGIIMRGWPA